MHHRLAYFNTFVMLFCCTAGLVQAADDACFERMWEGNSLDNWVAMHDANFEAREDMIVCTGRSNWPSWLRTKEVFENFILRTEYKIYYGGESGIYFSAPTAGRVSKIGFELQLNGTRGLTPYSTGAVFGAAAPLRQAPKQDPEQDYHELEIKLEWPRLEVRLNGHLVQDVDCEKHPVLRYKQRLGYIGLTSRGKRVEFRNLRIQRLPDQIRGEWQPMLNGKDLTGWSISDGCSAEWTVNDQGELTSSNGHGYLISDDDFYNMEWKCYINTTNMANGGIFFDWVTGKGRGFEVQIEDLLDSNDPTGSIYGRVRASNLPRKQGDWALLHVILRDNTCVVRVDGVTVAESQEMGRRRWGNISLQMHKGNASILWKDMQVRRLPSPDR